MDTLSKNQLIDYLRNKIYDDTTRYRQAIKSTASSQWLTEATRHNATVEALESVLEHVKQLP